MSPAAGMGIGELGAERFFVAGTDFQNAAGVQDLNAVAGTISAKQFRTKAAASYAGGADTTYTGATYPVPCAGGNELRQRHDLEGPPDDQHQAAHRHQQPGAQRFQPVLAVYDGAPLTPPSRVRRPTTSMRFRRPNPNETFGTAKAVTVGSRAVVLGNEASMASDYASTQFQAFQLGAVAEVLAERSPAPTRSSRSTCAPCRMRCSRTRKSGSMPRTRARSPRPPPAR